MIKRLLLISLACVSNGALAHGHYPQVMSSYVASEQVRVEFTLGNYFNKKTCFDIEINGEILTPMRECLASNQTKKMAVWVQSPADIMTENQVCSIANTPGMLRTRMCTIATTLYPKKQMAGME